MTFSRAGGKELRKGGKRGEEKRGRAKREYS
jgi:hypothetical protein